jgi:glycosyltransferase involved in cell wall biosynthesis
MSERRHVLVITADSLSTRMAGPAIRAFEIAKAVSAVADVKLVSTVHASLTHPGLEIVDASQGGLRPAVNWADVIVLQGHILSSFPWISATDKIIVADIYDPMHLEDLEQSKERPFAERVHLSADVSTVLNEQIIRADFMVCASEKQRDFWLGQASGMGRINPATYDQDSSLRGLIDVVSFGVQDAAPVQKRHAIKGAIDGIGPDDKVILWGGGIYNWFDPLTLIRAVGRLAERRPEVRLFFLGVSHPNPDVPRMQMVNDAFALSDELGLTDRVVFFNEGWVPYDERANYLLDADLGVSTHLDHLETRYSFRTRILDYLWASLPVVATDGDTFAEIIVRRGIGQVVPPDDIDALEQALERVLFDEDARAGMLANVQALADSMKWEKVLRPLIDFCATGQRAPDLVQGLRITPVLKISALEGRVRGLEESFSWRVTKPIRALSTALRRARG